MSITSQQLDSLVPCTSTEIKPIDISSISTFDISTLDFSSISLADYTPTGSYSNVTYSGIASLTTADIVVLGGSGGSGSSYTIAGGSGGSGSYVYGSSSTSYTWTQPEEWVDNFPDFRRIQKMCEKYPGLKVAYDKFVTTYKMVKDDYDNPPNKK